MRRTFVWFILAALLILSIAAAAHAAPLAKSPSITVTVNGQPQHFDTPPLMVKDRVLVPLRGVFESLGVSVIWDSRTNTVTAKNSDQVQLQVGRREALVGERKVTLEVAPQMYLHRVYVPLRFLSESLGATVAWHAEERSVVIASAPPKVAGFRSEPKSSDDGVMPLPPGHPPIPDDSDQSPMPPSHQDGMREWNV